MSTGTRGRTILSSLFAGTDSDDDSAFDPDVSIRSNETGGDSLFEELSLASGDVLDIYGQDTRPDADDSDDDSRSEATDSSVRSEDRVSARRANRGVSRSTSAEVTATARPTRSRTIDQGPPETVAIAQAAPATNNNNHSGHLEPDTAPPPKRSRPAPCAAEGGEGGEGAAGGDRAEVEEISNQVEGTTTRGGATATGEVGNSVPKGRSKEAHELYNSGDFVFISFDVETGGEDVGVIQISAEIFRLDLVRNKKTTGKYKGQINEAGDTASNIRREPEVFDEYVKPTSDAEWNEKAMETHHLHPEHPSIVSASDVTIVWRQFVDWVERKVGVDETAILVAWHGESCDMKWIWRLTQAPGSTLSMPDKIAYFLDPEIVIRSRASCKLHKSKSKMEGTQLSTVWKFATGRSLPPGQAWHNSIVDVKGQTDIVIDPRFVSWIDRDISVRSVEKIFANALTREWRKKLEPLKTVHSPWTEQTAEASVEWEPDLADRYTGPDGGSIESGPSSRMKEIIRTATSLAPVFLFVMPWSFWNTVAKRSHAYAYENYVVPVPTEAGKRPKLKQCRKSTPGHRHRADNEKNKFTFCASYVLVWIAVLILMGAHYGSYKPPSRAFWARPPYGISHPYIQNALTGNSFEFMRRYFHPALNKREIPKGKKGYDPLFKIRFVLDVVMKGLAAAWVAGQWITIDESMIKYKGKYVGFVQYMRDKPIKHGIKVFSCNCSVTAVCLSFFIYVGKEYTEDGSALAVCTELISKAGLTGVRGRVLTTDNWYTSIALAIHLFEVYGWALVGTIVATDKQTREKLDFPFGKLSKGAVKELPRGWFREAVIKLATKHKKAFYIQATTWRDKKQVCFVNSHRTGTSHGKNITVRRGRKGSREKEVLAGTIAQREYAKWYAAVDRSDRDSADYSTTIQTHRFYLRINCWVLDRVVHLCYVAVCFGLLIPGPVIAMFAVWKVFTSKNGGRKKFQIKLGLDIMNYAISKAWDGKSDRPDWMRQGPFIPCDCKECYFCLNGHTTGISHTKKAKVKVVSLRKGLVSWTEECTEVAVNIGRGSDFCRQCMRKNKGATDQNGKKLSYRQRQKLKSTKYSRMGCPQCDEHICQACWTEGYDKHQQMKSK